MDQNSASWNPVIGLVPALRVGEGLGLHAGETRTTSDRQGERLRTLLVAGQIAMTLVLLISGGLLIHSFVRLGRWLPGGVLPSDAHSSSEARSERRTGFGPSGFPR